MNLQVLIRVHPPIGTGAGWVLAPGILDKSGCGLSRPGWAFKDLGLGDKMSYNVRALTNRFPNGS